MNSVKTSGLAGQIDPSILPYIHFLPVSGADRINCHPSGEDNAYWDFFESIVKCQSTSSDELFPALRESFLELPFHEQLATFEHSQQLTQDQSRIRWQIAVDILSAIRTLPELRKCDAIVFGSLVTGLSNIDSDIDISVDIYGDNGEIVGSKSMEEEKRIILDFRSLLEVLLRNAPSPYDATQKFFSTVFCLEKPVELIRLKEAQTGISMDLTFESRRGIRSTKILQFYMNFEPRTKQLIIFLRYWAKFHQICAPHKLAKWPFTLLILVFLMEKNMIPSLLLLQAIATFQQSQRGKNDNQDTHNSYFCDDREVISKYFTPAVVIGPNSTPEEDAKVFLELLTDFFRMVVKSRFSISLVSPLLGQIVRKEDVAKAVSQCVNALPVEVAYCWNKFHPKYFENMNLFSNYFAVIIQDPFTLDVNTARQCRKNHRDKLVTAAKHTLSHPSTFLELFMRPSDAIKEQFAGFHEHSEYNQYINILLAKCVKRESEEATMLLENITNEILQNVRDLSGFPKELFQDTEKFDAIRLDRSKQFLDSYLVKLYKWKMLGSSEDVPSWQIRLHVIALWGMLAKQYLEDFFTKGLILPDKGITMKKVDVICPISTADMWTYDDTYTQEQIACFEKMNVIKVKPELVNKPRERIGELSIPDNSIWYGVIEVKVTYPFWKRKYNKRISNLDGEADVSEESYKEYLNKPIEIAKGASVHVPGFLPFFIYVVYKLDTRADKANQLCAAPSVTLAVQEFNDGDISQEVRLERMLARKCLMEIFERTFEFHLLRKLTKWSKM